MIDVIANVIGFIGASLMVLMGALKRKKDVLFVQNIQLLLLSVANIMLGGYTGAIVNFIAMFRNMLCSKDKLTKGWIIVIFILTIILGILFNNDSGLLGYLPCIATLIYLIFMNIKDMVKFKMLTAFDMMLWFIYDFKIGGYTIAFFDVLTVISSFISMYYIIRDKKKINKKK